MIITIIPFTVAPTRNFGTPLIGYEEEQIKKDDPPITNWRLYLDDKHVSLVSSKELAERTKL